MPSREPFEYVRDKGAVFDRVVFTPGTYEPHPLPPGPPKWNPIRVQLLWDPDFGPVELCDSEVTSESATAQELKSTRNRGLEMVESECRWLHRQLGELIAVWDARDAALRHATGVDEPSLTSSDPLAPVTPTTTKRGA